jgi:hypothetical protein
MQLSIKQMSALLALCPNVEYLEAILNDSIDTYLSKFPQIGSIVYLKHDIETTKELNRMFTLSNSLMNGVKYIVKGFEVSNDRVTLSYKKAEGERYESERISFEEFDLFFTSVKPLPELSETMLEADVPMAYGKAQLTASSDELV